MIKPFILKYGSKVLLGSNSSFGDKRWPWKTPPIERLGFNPEEGEVMCYEKSVNIFEQNMRERQKLQCSSMRGSVKGLQRIARQKAPVIKENAKYSFVELGKFNTSLYTRRILKRFWRVHCTNTALGRRCTTMLQSQQLIEVWTLSVARILISPHSPLLQLLADSDFIQSQKRAQLAPDPLLCVVRGYL